MPEFRWAISGAGGARRSGATRARRRRRDPSGASSTTTPPETPRSHTWVTRTINRRSCPAPRRSSWRTTLTSSWVAQTEGRGDGVRQRGQTASRRRRFADNAGNQLDFDEFVSLVCQMATLAWHRPAGAHERKTDGKDRPSLSTGREGRGGRSRGESGRRQGGGRDAEKVRVATHERRAELRRRLALYARRQIHNPRDLDAYPRYDKYAHVDAVSSVEATAPAISASTSRRCSTR